MALLILASDISDLLWVKTQPLYLSFLDAIWLHESFHTWLLFGHWPTCSGLYWFPNSWISVLTLVYTLLPFFFTILLRSFSPESFFWTWTQCFEVFYLNPICYSLNAAFSQDLHAEVLIPDVTMLDSGTLVRGLDHAGGALRNEMSALIRRGPLGLPSLFHHVKIQWEV